jgi:formylmethanofuran dehydrogenase subunit E-like metal-binding protein
MGKARNPKAMRRWVCFTLTLLAFLSGVWAGTAASEAYSGGDATPEMKQAYQTLSEFRENLGLWKGDRKILALTNAGSAMLQGQSTEGWVDAISHITGCTWGSRSLLMIQSSETEPFWFSLFRKDTGKMMYARWGSGEFRKQVIGVQPETLLNTEAWKKSADGLIGRKNLFQTASISMGWAQQIPWPLLKSTQFHGHFCPGLVAGYLVHEYLKVRFPLRQGERYAFLGAPAYCPSDAMQVLFDSPMGRTGSFAVGIESKKLAQYSGRLWFDGIALSPLLVVAMRINPTANSCEGVVMGLNWKKAFEETETKNEDLAPSGGEANPLYHVSRVRMALKMLTLKLEDQLKWLVEVKRFSGPAGLMQEITREGADPYAVAFVN